MSKEYKYIKPLETKPDLPKKAHALSKARQAAKEFIDSGVKYAEVEIKDYKNTTALARSLGRILHAKSGGLDPNRNIEVRSDKAKGKVYLLRE